MVRGLRSTGLPNTITSSPTAKYFSMNGRFHHRQCSRAVPSSRISSKMDLVCCLIPLDAEGDDLAPRRRRLAELQLGNGPELAAVLVAAGPMQQQVFDGADLQPGQLRRAFRADAVQGCHRPGQGRGRLFGRRGRHPPHHTMGNPESEARNPKVLPALSGCARISRRQRPGWHGDAVILPCAGWLPAHSWFGRLRKPHAARLSWLGWGDPV